jgi:hypothetical protein
MMLPGSHDGHSRAQLCSQARQRRLVQIAVMRAEKERNPAFNRAAVRPASTALSRGAPPSSPRYRNSKPPRPTRSRTLTDQLRALADCLDDTSNVVILAAFILDRSSYLRHSVPSPETDSSALLAGSLSGLLAQSSV